MKNISNEMSKMTHQLVITLEFMIYIWMTTAEVTIHTQVPRMKMLNKDQIYTVNPGQSLELQCEFYMEQFDLFNNPVIWRKLQLNESTPMNIMSNILEPFVSTHRFTVEMTTHEPSYRLVLTIEDAKTEDYGNYTCEVHGKDSVSLGSVNHLVYVTAPVQSIFITNMKSPSALHNLPAILTYTESQPGVVYCVSVGGCPPPQLALHIDQTEVSRHFPRGYTSTMSGEMGLRQITPTSEIWSSSFTVTAEADNKQLRCQGSADPSTSNFVSVTLRVRYAPLVYCEKTYALVGDRHVTIQCTVKARPGIDSLFWITDRNMTIRTTGDVYNHYQFQNVDRGNGKIETRLYISKVLGTSFRSYTVVAENIIGRTEHQAILYRRNQPSLDHSGLHVVIQDMSKVDSQSGRTYHTPPTHDSASRASAAYSILLAVLLTSFVTCFRFGSDR